MAQSEGGEMAGAGQERGLHLYTAAFPTGYRATVLLEELGLPYTLHEVDLPSGEHLKPPYTEGINPAQLIPALVDGDQGGLRVIESGAVMLYLCECVAIPAGGTAAQVATELLPPPSDAVRRAAVLSWLFHQTSTYYAAARRFIAPLASRGAPSSPETVRYAAKQLYAQLLLVEAQLQKTGAYVAGDFYSVADIACLPYVLTSAILLGVDMAEETPGLHTWAQRLLDRPAVRKGMRLPAPYRYLAPGPEADQAVHELHNKLVGLGLDDLKMDSPRLALPD